MPDEWEARPDKELRGSSVRFCSVDALTAMSAADSGAAMSEAEGRDRATGCGSALRGSRTPDERGDVKGVKPCRQNKQFLANLGNEKLASRTSQGLMWELYECAPGKCAI